MSKKILVLDDSATALALFKACFPSNLGYEILAVRHTAEAMAIVEKYQPNAIVLDYNMPESTGTEVAKMMQDNGIKARYFLLTANTQQSVIKEAESLGFCDVIEKPVTLDSLQKLIENLP